MSTTPKKPEQPRANPSNPKAPQPQEKNDTDWERASPLIQATIANAKSVYDASKGITGLPYNVVPAIMTAYAQTRP